MPETTSALATVPATDAKLPVRAIDLENLQLPIPVQPRPPRFRGGWRVLRTCAADAACLVPLLGLAGAAHVVGAPGDGREPMLGATLLSAVLLWVLARRLGQPRLAAAPVLLIFSLSPLAVHVHQTVDDNLPLTGLLAAFVLVTARRWQLLAFPLAGAAAAAAAFAEPTFLLFTPFVVWAIWQATGPRVGRIALAVLGTILAVGGYAYVLASLAGREPLPGEEGIGLWWSLDPVLIVAAAAAAASALAFARLRPTASALLLVLLLTVMPYSVMPVSLVVVMVALTALLVPAVVHRLAVMLRSRLGRPDMEPLAIMFATGLAVAVTAAAVAWPPELRDLVRAAAAADAAAAETALPDSGRDRPVAAERSPEAPAEPGETVVTVDRPLWTDPAGIGSAADTVPFDELPAPERQAIHYAADQLLRNESLTFDAAARAAIGEGLIDPRLILILGQLSGAQDLDVSLPALLGEDPAPRRQLVLSAVGTEDAAARLGLWLLGQPAPFTPAEVDVDGADVTAIYSVAAPRGLLPGPPQQDD